MIKRSFVLLFFITSLLTHSFAQTANITKGCVPLQVVFQAPASSATYFWDFKDGVTTNLPNPTNVFSSPGIYHVTFQESPSGPVLGTIQIEVYPDPVLNITATSGCAPLNSQFTNISQVDPGVTVTSYTWVFGDGQSFQGLTEPSHMYFATGKYDVSLGIQTVFPTCNKTTIFSEVVDLIDRPEAFFSTVPATPFSCNDSLDVTFVNESTGTADVVYAWDLGNGVVSSSPNPPSQRYFQGQYTPMLTATYPGKNGCVSAATKTIRVGRPVATILPDNDTVCINSPLKVKTSTPGTYSWDIGLNAVAADLTGDLIPDTDKDSVLITFTTPGFHKVLLTISSGSVNGTCSDTISTSVYVDEVTAEIQSSDPTFRCENPMVSNLEAVSNQTAVEYSWTFSTGDPDTAKVVTRTNFSGSDTIYYDVNRMEEFLSYLTVSSLRTGCSASDSRKDTLWLPNALFMPDKVQGCAPLNVTFSDSSKSFDDIVKWEWIFGDGTSQVKTDKSSIAHVYSTAGEYLVTLVVTTTRGCIDTSYAVLIEVGTNLSSEVNFTVDKTEVCPGELVVLEVSPTSPKVDAYHFYTDENRSYHCIKDTVVQWVYNHKTGPQDVTLTMDYNGCFSSIKKLGLVNVKGAIAKIDYRSLCSSPMVYSFIDSTSSQGSATLVWDFGDGQSSSAQNEDHTYALSGTYFVKLTALDASSGCTSTTDTKIINVRNLKAEMAMDTLLCINTPYQLDGSASSDVDISCYKGYSWQFPEMDKRPYTSTDPTVDFSFNVPGKYVARLVVRDINGCTDTATTNFEIFDIVVQPTADKLWICNPADVQFTDMSVGDTTLVSFAWSFGDGNSSSVQHPSHTYTSPPPLGVGYSYDAYLTITDILGCEETNSVSIQQYEPVSSVIGTPSLSICYGDTVIISATDYTTAGSSLTYSWDFGNGETSTDQTNKILYADLQNYDITLNYSEISSGCAGSTTATVQIQDYPTAGMTTPNIMGLEVLCAPQIVNFQDSSQSNFLPLSHYWDFGNGQTSASDQFYLTYPKGNFTAQHIVQTSFGCTDTVSRSYKVFETTGNFDMDRNTICKGEEIIFTIRDTSDVASYTWAFGDGIIATDQAPVTHQYNFHPPSGQTQARLIVEGFDGICPVERQRAVFIREVIADFIREDGIDTSICFNDGPYNFTNTSLSADTYLWDFGDGQTSTVQDPINHQYPSSGVYDVKLSIANAEWGCKDTIIWQAVVYDNPVLTAIGDTACQGNTLQLQVVNPVGTDTYRWVPATGLSADNITNPISSILNTLSYTVIQTDTNGCTDSEVVPAIVIEPINLQDWDTSIVIGDQVALPVYGPPVYIFTWTPPDGLSCLDCNYPLVRPLEDITYNLRVQDVRGCWDDSYNFRIEVKPETFVKLPSLFTPDGDGANDRLYVKGWGIKELLDFQIFNRWGQLVYSSQNINEGWDGKFKNVLQNSDVYAYKVKVLTWRDETLFAEGFVNLLHAGSK